MNFNIFCVCKDVNHCVVSVITQLTLNQEDLQGLADRLPPSNHRKGTANKKRENNESLVMQGIDAMLHPL
jgi:hypothetical protein